MKHFGRHARRGRAKGPARKAASSGPVTAVIVAFGSSPACGMGFATGNVGGFQSGKLA